MGRVYNFSAGPAVLPEEVLKEAAAEMLDYNGTGMSVMEMSHRSKAFEEIITAAEQDLRDLMGIPDNYKVLFQNDEFWTSFKNTVFLIFFVTLFTIGFALFFAAVLSKGKTKGKTFFRIVFYIPNILSVVVISAIFSAVLNPSYGVISAIAKLFNTAYTGWLGDMDKVMWCITFAMVWQAIGYYMVMYIAGMDSVPDELYEAADLEGCGKMRQFFVITVPLTWEVIRTTLTFFIISTINMSFLFVNAMTQGEANSHVLLSYMYEFFGSQYGYAMAIGTVVFVVAYAVSLLVQFLTRREVIQY